jgi:hypothetical protein
MPNPPRTPDPAGVPFLVTRSGVALLFVAALAALPGCQSIGSVDPDPIEGASSGERTDDAIRDALRRDGWEIETWSPGEIFAAKISDGEPLRVRIHLEEDHVQVSWIDDGSLDGTIEENNERKREIRRALSNLADRIQYHIQSVDLEARNDDARHGARNDDARPSAALDRPLRSSTTR